MEDLKSMQVGGFKELVELPNPLGLELLYIPSLEAVLRKMETKKGAPLTETEVQRGSLDETRGKGSAVFHPT